MIYKLIFVIFSRLKKTTKKLSAKGRLQKSGSKLGLMYFG